VKRTPWSFILAAAGVAILLPSACSNNLNLPPSIGDCIPMGDASCIVSRTGAGSGAPVGDGGAFDAPIITSGEAGMCPSSPADQTVASYTQNPECVPCILGASSEAGGFSCCMSDSMCDEGCVAILQCALATCRGSASCIGTTCEGFTASPTSVSNYNAFGSCLAQICPQCPSLPQGTPVGDL